MIITVHIYNFPKEQKENMIFSLEIKNIYTIIDFARVKFWSYSWLAYISRANQQEQSFIFGQDFI